MKKRVVEAKLMTEVGIFEQQYGFKPRKSTTDVVLALRVLIKKVQRLYRAAALFLFSFGESNDRATREKSWCCMRKPKE